jgi:hypothetical protein
VLSRWQFRGRLLLLQGTLLLHAFPAITLIIAVFFVLRALYLLHTLAGVMLVKVALELPFALWVMKGFLMTSLAGGDGCPGGRRQPFHHRVSHPLTTDTPWDYRPESLRVSLWLG